MNFELIEANLFDSLFNLLFGLIAFIVVAGGVYAFNDASDAHLDALHPVKKNRPIPSGHISKRAAYGLSFAFFTLGSATLWVIGGVGALSLSLVYIVLNIIYSVKFKTTPFVEILIVVSGYPIRILLGAVLIGAPTTWYFLALFTLFALALVLAKRLAQKNSDNKSREVLRFYTRKGLQYGIAVSCFSAWVIFSAWILDGHILVDNHLLVSGIIGLAASGFFFFVVGRNAINGKLEHPEDLIRRPRELISGTAMGVATLLTLSKLI